MSIESRLAAKERSRKARRKAAAKKWTAILIVPVLLLCVLIGYLIYKSVTTVNYSKYIAKDGTIQGVVAKECFSEFPNLDDITVDCEPTDEEIQTKLKNTIKSLEEAVEGEETSENTSEVIDYEGHLNDEWVEKYAAEKLGEDYAHTEEGFREYVKQLAHEEKESKARSTVSAYLNEHTTVKTYPYGFTRNQRKVLKKQSEKSFEVWKAYGFYSQYETYEDFILANYESKSAYRKALRTEAKESTKTTLIWLAVFDELNLSCTVEDVKAFEIEQGGKSDATEEEKNKYWDDLVEEFGQPFLMLEYRETIAQDTLVEKVLAKAHGN